MRASRVVIRFLKGKLQEQERQAAERRQLYDGAVSGSRPLEMPPHLMSIQFIE